MEFQKETKSDIAERFLQAFVRESLNSYIKQKRIKEFEIKVEQSKIMGSIASKSIQKNTIIQTNQIQKVQNLQPVQKVNPIQMNQMQKIPSPIQTIRPSQVKENLPTNIPTFEKIEKILMNPSVISVECSGVEKPLLINNRGILQSSNIILSKDEIDSLINNISQKTKIPIIPGVFKAAFGNYIILAVISEFVGTRFTIQKKQGY